MRIWFKEEISLDQLNRLGDNTLGEHLAMKFTEIGDNYLKATMPVDHRTQQPYGLLHGGASAALAETLCSVASALVIDTDKNICVGLEINANHVRGVKSGWVSGMVSPIHIGASTHVWDIKIVDEKEKLVCVSRLTVAILPKK
jgi:1,4-dihydroxy-2-naphthoyl-CoA hydrolase